MKDLLPGRLTIGKKKVHALTLHTTFTQRCRDALSNAEHLRTILCIQISERRRMSARNNQSMARVDRLNVHQREAEFILMDDTHFQFTRYEFAKYAVGFIHRLLSAFTSTASGDR